MRYIENLESVNKKMIIDENGLKITQDAILLSEFIKKYFNTKYKNNIIELSLKIQPINIEQNNRPLFPKNKNKFFSLYSQYKQII